MDNKVESIYLELIRILLQIFYNNFDPSDVSSTKSISTCLVIDVTNDQRRTLYNSAYQGILVARNEVMLTFSVGLASSVDLAIIP